MRRAFTVVLVVSSFTVASYTSGLGVAGPNAGSATAGPRVTSVSPSSVYWGDVITISGKGFGNAIGSVSIGSIDAKAVSSWTDTAIKIMMPSGVDPGDAALEGQTTRSPRPGPRESCPGRSHSCL